MFIAKMSSDVFLRSWRRIICVANLKKLMAEERWYSFLLSSGALDAKRSILMTRERQGRSTRRSWSPCQGRGLVYRFIQSTMQWASLWPSNAIKSSVSLAGTKCAILPPLTPRCLFFSHCTAFCVLHSTVTASFAYLPFLFVALFDESLWLWACRGLYTARTLTMPASILFPFPRFPLLILLSLLPCFLVWTIFYPVSFDLAPFTRDNEERTHLVYSNATSSSCFQIEFVPLFKIRGRCAASFFQIRVSFHCI